MPSEFHNREPPLPFGNPKSRPWYGMDIFWNRPMLMITGQNNFNPVSPDSDQHQFSPNNINTLSKEMVARIHELIAKRKML